MITAVPDEEPAGAYAALAVRLGTAWASLSGGESVRAPWGECTALEAVRGFTVETVTHGWDLAVATGRPSEAPVGIADRCLLVAEDVIPDRLRGVMYDDAVPVATDAPATERLAYRLGRRRPLLRGDDPS